MSVQSSAGRDIGVFAFEWSVGWVVAVTNAHWGRPQWFGPVRSPNDQDGDQALSRSAV